MKGAAQKKILISHQILFKTGAYLLTLHYNRYIVTKAHTVTESMYSYVIQA